MLAEALLLPAPRSSDPRDRHGYYTGLLDDGTDPDWWPILEYDPEALNSRNCVPVDDAAWPSLPLGQPLPSRSQPDASPSGSSATHSHARADDGPAGQPSKPALKSLGIQPSEDGAALAKAKKASQPLEPDPGASSDFPTDTGNPLAPQLATAPESAPIPSASVAPAHPSHEHPSPSAAVAQHQEPPHDATAPVSQAETTLEMSQQQLTQGPSDELHVPAEPSSVHAGLQPVSDASIMPALEVSDGTATGPSWLEQLLESTAGAALSNPGKAAQALDAVSGSPTAQPVQDHQPAEHSAAAAADTGIQEVDVVAAAAAGSHSNPKGAEVEAAAEAERPGGKAPDSSASGAASTSQVPCIQQPASTAAEDGHAVEPGAASTGTPASGAAPDSDVAVAVASQPATTSRKKRKPKSKASKTGPASASASEPAAELAASGQANEMGADPVGGAEGEAEQAVSPVEPAEGQGGAASAAGGLSAANSDAAGRSKSSGAQDEPSGATNSTASIKKKKKVCWNDLLGGSKCFSNEYHL